MQITKQIDPPILPIKPALYKPPVLELIIWGIEIGSFFITLFMLSNILNHLRLLGQGLVILAATISIFVLDRFFSFLISYHPDNREKFAAYRSKKRKILQDYQQDIKAKTKQFQSIMHPLVCWEYYPHSFAPNYEVTWYFGGNNPETNEFAGAYVTQIKGNGLVQFPEAYFDRQGRLNLGNKVVLYVKSEIDNFTVPQSILNDIPTLSDDPAGRK